MRMNRWFRAVAMVTLVSMTGAMTTGCFGSFKTVQKVWEFNHGVDEEKWVKEGVFLALTIVPVYGMAGVLDMVFMNAAEFWTGENPLMSETRNATGNHGESASLTHNPDGTVDLTMTAPDGSKHFMKLIREANTLTAFDEQGQLIGRVAEKNGHAALLEDEEGE